MKPLTDLQEYIATVNELCAYQEAYFLTKSEEDLRKLEAWRELVIVMSIYIEKQTNHCSIVSLRMIHLN